MSEQINKDLANVRSSVYFLTILSSAIIATPLFIWNIETNPRHIFAYPIFVILLAFSIAWILIIVTGIQKKDTEDPSAPSSFLFLIIGCVSVGFFPGWVAPLVGRLLFLDTWGKGLFVANLFVAFAGICGGFIALFFFQATRKPFSRRFFIMGLISALIVEGLWIFVQAMDDLPAFWAISYGGYDPEVAVYILFQTLMGQLIWPLGILLGLFLCLSKLKRSISVDSTDTLS